MLWYLGQPAALREESSQLIMRRLCVNHPMSLSASTNRTDVWTGRDDQLWPTWELLAFQNRKSTFKKKK